MATNWKQLLTDYVDSLEAAIGAVEGGTTLHNKLTAARAAFLDAAITSRAAAADWTAALAAALGNYTAARAAYLDNINQVGLLQVTAARATLLDQITAIRLAELDAANIPADIDTLLARLTALRAGYLDNLSAGAVAKEADLISQGATDFNATAKTALQVAAAAALAAVAYTRQAGVAQVKPTTIDLNQAAGTYDLFTGTTQDVLVEGFVIRMSGGAIGGAVTSISVQTDDTTAQVLITAAEGAVANLTDQAQLSWAPAGGVLLLKATKKIRLTIAGGAAGVARVCDVITKCRAVVSGGYLA